MIFIVLIIGIGVFYLSKGSTKPAFGRIPQEDPVELLKNRYAKGDIDDETYQRMLKMLNS